MTIERYPVKRLVLRGDLKMVNRKQRTGDRVPSGMLPTWCTGLHIVLTLMLSGVLFAPPTSAAVFTVNSIEDMPDLDPGNGMCVAYIIFIPPCYVLPFCTLRAAIQETNALNGSDVIQLQASEYLLHKAGAGDDLGATGDLDITGPLSILGSGTGQTVVNGNGMDRVFDIHTDASSVLLANLTITGGRPAAGNEDGTGGGGVRNRGGLRLNAVQLAGNSAQDFGPDKGGGIYNQGTCTVDQSTVSSNTARLGGGIYNDAGGTLTVRTSTIDQNSGNDGGGLYSRGIADLTNVTVSGNRASSGFGGGVWNQGSMRLLQATVTNNVAAGGGAGIDNNGWATVFNTIIAKNTGGECSGQALLSSGGNLVGEGCLNMSRLGSDLVGVDPQLGILADNSGPTRTHAIYYTSPAANQGMDLSSLGIVTDQRGLGRPIGGRYDIGAFEATVPVPSFITPLLLSQ
jgi:CSLREA domain-containing protein